MAKKTRAAAVCGAVLLAAVLLFSVLFVVAEADHHCSGEHCAICQQIQSCQQLLEQLAEAHPAAAGAALLCLLPRAVLPAREAPAPSSPVLLKIKLLN